MSSWIANFIGFFIVVLLTILSAGLSAYDLTTGALVISYSIIILYSFISLTAILIQNKIIIPRLLWKRKWIGFFIAIILLLFLTTIFSSLAVDVIARNNHLLDFDVLNFFDIILLTSQPAIDYWLKTIVAQAFLLLVFGITAILRKLYFKQQNLDKLALLNITLQHNQLKAQVNPHFLFNVLNSMYALSIKKSDKLPTIILNLADILRYNLYETNEDSVALQKEVDILALYIKLEQIRMNSNHEILLNFKDIDPSYKIAPLILLPIVENAFKHGLSTSIQDGYIYINVFNVKEGLFFECKNNYKYQQAVKSDASGLGLKNLKDRLELIYNSNYSLVVEDNGKDFLVILKIYN